MNVDKIVDVINEGGVVITPTDTIYGIMGDAMNEEVIKKVFEIKKRPFCKPLLLLMNSFEMVEQYTEEISEKERILMDRFWPGLVTFILKKNDKVSDLITSGNNTVGVRIPDNKNLLEIISRLNRPVISTSANITGTEVITSTQLLEKDLIDNIDYIEDGGELDNVSSTIIRIENDELKILRVGKISKEIEDYYKENI